MNNTTQNMHSLAQQILTRKLAMFQRVLSRLPKTQCCGYTGKCTSKRERAGKTTLKQHNFIIGSLNSTHKHACNFFKTYPNFKGSY